MARRDDLVRGTLMGLIVGFVAGLLLAPQSGEETRDQIKRRAKRLYGDTTDKARQLSDNIGAKVEELKSVAKDLSGQAKEESQDLIARAEVLKHDLRHSTKKLAEAGKQAKDETITDIRHLMDEGSTLMTELEGITKRLVRSARERLSRSDESTQPAGEATRRVEELERNNED